MDFSQIIQGTRQYFQGHPGLDEASKNQRKPAPYPTATGLTAETWFPKSGKTVDIPPEIEARYANHALGLPISNGHPPANKSQQPSNQQPDPGINKQQIVNGNNLTATSSDQHERPKTSEWSSTVPTSKPQQRVETPLDLSVKPDEPVMVRSHLDFPPSQDPASVQLQWQRAVHQLPAQASSLKVDPYPNHNLLRPQHQEVYREHYSVPENPYPSHHQSGNSVIRQPVHSGDYKKEQQQQHLLDVYPRHSPQVPPLNRPSSEPCPPDCRQPEHNHYTPGLRLPSKNVIVPSSERASQRPQVTQQHPQQYNMFQPYRQPVEPSPVERVHPPQSYSESYAQTHQSPAGPVQTQHIIRQYLPSQEKQLPVHHSSPYSQPPYSHPFPQQPTLLTHRPAQPQPQPQPQPVQMIHRPNAQPIYDGRQAPLLHSHPQSHEQIRWQHPQQHYDSRIPSMLQTHLQPSEPVQKPPSQHRDARPPSTQQLHAVANESIHRPPSVEQLSDNRLPPPLLQMHSHPQYRSSHVQLHQPHLPHPPHPQPFQQPHHPSEVIQRPQYDGRSLAPYQAQHPQHPLHRPHSPQQPPVPFQPYMLGQSQTISRPQAIPHAPLGHPYTTVPPSSAPQQQHRAPPVATVSATVRNSASGNSAILPTKIIAPGAGSKMPPREAFPLPPRPTFPWLQRNTSRSDVKIPAGINPPGMTQGSSASMPGRKPVGVAMVSFKTAVVESSTGRNPVEPSATSAAPHAKESSKAREFNLATHPFPHLAAAAAAASAKSSTATPMTLKFRTKAELKQMSNPIPPTIPSLGTQPAPMPIPVPVVVQTRILPPPPPVIPADPIIEDDKWSEFSKPLTNEWESFMKDLKECSNIKRIRRVTKPEPKQTARRKQQVQDIKSATPPPVKKNVKDYSSDEDIPLSLRQKIVQDQQRAERLERRKRRSAPRTRIRVCKRRIVSDSESESHSDDASDSSASLSLDDDESESEESSDSDGGSMVERIRLRRSTVIQRSLSLNSAASSSSGGSRKSSSSSSSYPAGWEGDALSFKQQLRMPPQLINVCMPRNVREVADPPDCKAKKPFHHIRCANTGNKWKNSVRGKSKKKASGVDQKTKQLAVYSRFAWINRWNYQMFRTSLLYSTSGRRRYRRRKGQSAVKSSGRSRRSLAKRIQAGSMVDNKKQVTSATVPAKQKRLKMTRRRFRSGFDYIRRKKKKSQPASTSERPKAPNKDYQLLGATLDPATEVRSWVLNKCLGETLLHRAAKLGYLEGVRYLLERPETSVSAKDNAGYTPLHEACTRGHLEVARLLLQYGASESSSAQGGIRPLHQAVENDHIEVVRLLLSYGADPTLATYGGQTPLMSCESDDMRIFLAAHLDDINGDSSRPWVFDGSACCMDGCESGVVEHPLNSSSYVDALHSRAIALDSSRSFDAVDIQLYELVDRRLNPWLQLDTFVDYLVRGRGPPHLRLLPAAGAAYGSSDGQQEALCRQFAHQLIVDTAASRITLSAQSFASLAVPVLRRTPQPQTAPQSTRPLVLLHYNERVQKLLDVESVTFSL